MGAGRPSGGKARAGGKFMRAVNPRGLDAPSGQALRGRGLVHVNCQAAAARTGWTNQERLGTTATETLEVLLPKS